MLTLISARNHQHKRHSWKLRGSGSSSQGFILFITKPTERVKGPFTPDLSKQFWCEFVRKNHFSSSWTNWGTNCNSWTNSVWTAPQGTMQWFNLWTNSVWTAPQGTMQWFNLWTNSVWTAPQGTMQWFNLWTNSLIRPWIRLRCEWAISLGRQCSGERAAVPCYCHDKTPQNSDDSGALILNKAFLCNAIFGRTRLQIVMWKTPSLRAGPNHVTHSPCELVACHHHTWRDIPFWKQPFPVMEHPTGWLAVDEYVYSIPRPYATLVP